MRLPLQLGAGSWTFPWAVGLPGGPRPERPLSALEVLERTHALGLRLVQYGDNLPLHELGDAELTALRERGRELGMAFELGTCGIEGERMRRYLELCRFFGAKLLRTLTGMPGTRPPLREVIVGLRRVLPEFEDAGVTVALENYEAHRTREFAALVRDIGSPSLGICLDTVNSLGALEGFEEVLGNLASYVVNVHVKDFQITRWPHIVGFQVVGCPAGRGRLDLNWLFNHLQVAGRDPTVVLEQWPPFSGTLDATIALEERWAAEGVTHLRSTRWFEPGVG